VEDWQGRVTGGQARWRVAAKDYGTGPFRWVIYDAADGLLLAASGSFYLPASNYQIVDVQVMGLPGN